MASCNGVRGINRAVAPRHAPENRASDDCSWAMENAPLTEASAQGLARKKARLALR